MRPRPRSLFVFIAGAALVASSVLTSVAPVAAATPQGTGGGDPDRPPIGKKLPGKLFVKLRNKQIAYYRGYPFTLPYNPRQLAVEQMQQQLQQRSTGTPGVVPATNPAWTPIGPAPIPNGQVAGGATTVAVSGRVTAIVVDPTTENIAYVGTAQGGVYRTRDGGTTWIPLMDSAASLAVGALALDPSDRTKLFVGTGEGNLSGDSYSGVGLYMITGANGNTPTLQGPFETRVAGTGTPAANGHAFLGGSITSIAIDPLNDSNMYVGVTFGGIGKGNSVTCCGSTPNGAVLGLYHSGNAQAATPTFSLVNGLPHVNGIESVTDAVFEPGSSDNLIVGVEDFNTNAPDSGIYRSTNASNATPAFSRTLSFAANDWNVRFAINKVTTTVTVIAAREGSGGVVKKSTDGGTTWPTTLSSATGFCDPQCYYDITVAIDPGNANKIYLGGSADGGNASQFKRATDGSTFVTSDTGLHADAHAIAVAASNTAVIYAGNDGGIFKSANSGASWTSLNTSSFNATQFQSIAVHPSDPQFTLGGTQDNGTNLRNASGNWSRVDFGDGGFAEIDQNAANTSAVTMYHTYFNRANALIGYAVVTSTALATDGGWVFRGCSDGVTPANGIGCADNSLFYAPMALGPGNPNTVYFGTDRLYRSANRGLNNTVVSQAPIENGPSNAISAIGISPTDDNVRIVGLQNGDVWRTTTASSTLVNVTGSWAAQYVARAVIDPNSTAIAYVALDGFMGDTAANNPAASHVWRTGNLGHAPPTWTSAGSGIPDVPVNSLVVDPQDSTHLFAGTDIGVYKSTDSGANWSPYGTGLPVVAVFDMAVASDGSGGETLRIATHGRGMWEAPVTSTDSTPPTPSMTKPNTVITLGTAIPISWSAIDAGSGVASYDVRVRKAKYNGAFSSFTNISGLQATASTSKVFAATPGFTYCFSVRARDNAANLSGYSAEACTEVPVDDKTLTASSGWTRKSNVSGDYLKTISVSTTHNATLKLTGVKAMQIAFLATVCPGCGKVSVSFGSSVIGTASLASSTTKHVVFFASAFASTKTGTVTIKVTTSGKKVQIDALIAIVRGVLTSSTTAHLPRARLN